MLDNILKVSYELAEWNAQILSKMLKETLRIKYGVEDLEDYSQQGSLDNISETHPEIYEYQNFFVLRRNDGSYLLLDGFRRLLLYDGLPDFNVNVRIYNEKNLTQKDLIKLILMLNHTKFFGGLGKYYDKGFNLLFSILFGFDIIKFENVFEGYVIYEQETTDKRYLSNRTNDNVNKLTNIRERLTEDKTIEDLQFLYKVFQARPMINKFNYFGSLIYNTRQRFPDVKLSVDEFLRLTDDNDIKELEVNCPKPSGVRGSDHVNKLIQYYKKAINLMTGVTPEETYLEALGRVKSLKATLKKNKQLKHIKGKNDYLAKLDLLNDYIIKQNNFSPKLSILIYPGLEYKNIIEPGLYSGVIKEVSLTKNSFNNRISFKLEFDDPKIGEELNSKIEFELDGIFAPKIMFKFGETERGSKQNKFEVFYSVVEKTDKKVKIKDLRKNN